MANASKRDRHGAALAIHADALTVGFREGPRKARLTVDLLDGLHPNAATQEPPKMLRLRQLPFGSGRRNLKRELRSEIAEMIRDPLAQGEVDACRMVDEHL